MIINEISAGENPPYDINVIIEVPMGQDPVKYELDKNSGALLVDRIMHTSMRYPCNYGFVPHTLSDDGDPIDVLVVSSAPFISGSVVRSRPVGVLKMKDEKGTDEKILAVPVDSIYPYHSDVKDYSDLPEIIIDQVAHFFTHYKDLEKGKWVEIEGWDGSEKAAQFINEAVERAQKQAA